MNQFCMRKTTQPIRISHLIKSILPPYQQNDKKNKAKSKHANPLVACYTNKIMYEMLILTLHECQNMLPFLIEM